MDRIFSFVMLYRVILVPNWYVLEKSLCQTLKVAAAKTHIFLHFVCPTRTQLEKARTMILTKLEPNDSENYNFQWHISVVQVSLYIY